MPSDHVERESSAEGESAPILQERRGLGTDVGWPNLPERWRRLSRVQTAPSSVGIDISFGREGRAGAGSLG